MRTLTIESAEIKNYGVTFFCRDFEEESWNDFDKDENFIPRIFKVEYDCRIGKQAGLLTSIIRKEFPDAKSLKEGTNDFAKKCIGKSFKAFWDTTEKGFFFQY